MVCKSTKLYWWQIREKQNLDNENYSSGVQKKKHPRTTNALSWVANRISLFVGLPTFLEKVNILVEFLLIMRLICQQHRIQMQL